ncbi:peroxiredoxin [Azoarcus sp. KH32C]|uniref:peroxiredoxin n=1 Tax=Azoarcus sp. KH32C TaxID=748247 RepID=UPI0002386642|nr:peroxiredoxin [Azoarcus sp. KH32C]BAL25258.1 alkyl hydroperoxide reductase/Thiol specific antioxidant/Mal allergen [Azoarcus sp. KH32C]
MTADSMPSPDFELPATGGQSVSLAGLRGRNVVFYFYPKDNTPGCTNETMDFRDHHDAFQAAGCAVFGISRDSLKSHENFKAKLGLPFELISDTEELACNAFGVIKMKNMYGKQVRGIERSTFVIGADGRILREWRGVKVPSHAKEVLQFVQSL